MRPIYLFPAALLSSGVFSRVATITEPAVLIPRATPLACSISPTDKFPGLCSVNLGSYFASFSSMTTSSPKATSTPPPPAAPSCNMRDQDPSEGITSAYCICISGTVTKTAPLISAPPTAVITESCAYKTMPGAQITPVNALGPATTNIAKCEVCSRYAVNGMACSTIPNCLPQTGLATVYAGSSPVHVGTLTGTALYTSISSALEQLCPPVTQTKSATQCSETDKITIQGIDYVDSSEVLTKGQLVVKVATSSYNVTSLRDAMINSIALTAKNSATGKNCYDQPHIVESKKRSPLAWADRLLPFSLWGSSGLEERGGVHPVTEHITLCNSGWFASVLYFSPYWKVAQNPGPSDFIDAAWEFEVGPGGDFGCEFLADLTEELIAIEPEFAVGDIELAEEIRAFCTQASSF